MSFQIFGQEATEDHNYLKVNEDGSIDSRLVDKETSRSVEIETLGALKVVYE